MSGLTAVERWAPLRVREVTYVDPILTLAGSGWSLTLACPWRVTAAGLSFSWEDDEVEDLAWELVGHSIVAVRGSADPTFVLDGDLRLVVTADTDLDPWVLRLPDAVIVGTKA